MNGRRHDLVIVKMDNADGKNDLVLRSKRGDLDAFGELVRLHEDSLRCYLRVRIADWATADDLAQEAFLTAFRSLKNLREPEKFEPWLKGIAGNHLRNYRRKKRELYVGGSSDLQMVMDLTQSGDDMDQESDAVDALRDCVSKMDVISRALLVARYVKGKTMRELEDEALGSAGAVAMRLQRLREKLAACVEQTVRRLGEV